MALCPDTSGCAIVGGDGVLISGSGTAGDPWVINLVEPVDIADLESDVASLQASAATLPGTYVNTAGDTMTGTLTLLTSSVGLRLRRTSAETPFIDFYSTDGMVSYAFIQGSSSNLIVASRVGPVIFYADNAEEMRLDATRLLIGKNATDIATVGVEINHDVGQVFTTLTDAGSWNQRMNRIGAANADGQIYMSIEQAGTQIGRITRATSTTAGFLTTSDQDLKENLVPVDDELALLWLRTIEPLFFNYPDAPDVRHVGYSAQQIAEAWPNGVANGIIAPGHGDVNDRTWDEDGNEITSPDVWQAWMMDHAKITPILHSGLQAIDRDVQERTVVLDDHETRIAALEAQLASNQVELATLRAEVYYTRQMVADWDYSASTTAPPTAGQVRTNTTNTEMYLHKTDYGGYDRQAQLDFIVARTALNPAGVRLRLRGTTGSVLELRTTAKATNNGAYHTIPVGVVSGAGFTKGVRVQITMLSEIWAEDPPPQPTLLPTAEPDTGS